MKWKIFTTAALHVSHDSYFKLKNTESIYTSQLSTPLSETPREATRKVKKQMEVHSEAHDLASHFNSQFSLAYYISVLQVPFTLE